MYYYDLLHDAIWLECDKLAEVKAAELFELINGGTTIQQQCQINQFADEMNVHELTEFCFLLKNRTEWNWYITQIRNLRRLIQ